MKGVKIRPDLIAALRNWVADCRRLCSDAKSVGPGEEGGGPVCTVQNTELQHPCRQVRQIKSLESQLKWGLQREERRQTEEERREEASSWFSLAICRCTLYGRPD